MKIQQPEIGVSSGDEFTSPHRLHLHELHRTLPTPWDLKWLVRMVTSVRIFQHLKPGVFTLFRAPGYPEIRTTPFTLTSPGLAMYHQPPVLSNMTCQAGSSRRSLATPLISFGSNPPFSCHM